MGLKNIFPEVVKPVIGMLHLSPLPGSYNYQGMPLEEITEQALEDARALAEAGFDGFMIQNANDRPPSLELCPEKVAYMAVIGAAVRREYPAIPIGVSMTWNVPKGDIAVAHAIGGRFVRFEHVYIGLAVTPYGLVKGVSYEATQYLKLLDAKGKVEIFADVYEAHSMPIARLPIDVAVRQALFSCQADVALITGQDIAESMEMLRSVKKSVPNADILLAGGSHSQNIAEALEVADGVIVGRSIKRSSGMTARVSPEKAREYMDQVRRVREREKS
ncbi:MAG: BtpA/SgcQ family protein [Candidatus Tectomicrobia bacterium]|nr:BtpA/SgcQ family protein [Candidatus Tectomicrobia bacterium]